jgi:hypothetical protein
MVVIPSSATVASAGRRSELARIPASGLACGVLDACPASAVQELVAGDSEQPGLSGLRSWTESVSGEVGGGEHLREQIGRELRAAASAYQPAGEQALMAAIEDGKRLLMRVARSQQLGIGGILPVSPRHRKLTCASFAICDRRGGPECSWPSSVVCTPWRPGP